MAIAAMSSGISLATLIDQRSGICHCDPPKIVMLRPARRGDVLVGRSHFTAEVLA